MTLLVESLHRLFLDGKVSEKRLAEMLKSNPPKITDEEYRYIITK